LLAGKAFCDNGGLIFNVENRQRGRKSREKTTMLEGREGLDLWRRFILVLPVDYQMMEKIPLQGPYHKLNPGRRGERYKKKGFKQGDVIFKGLS